MFKNVEFKRFGKDENGNVMLMTALVFVPMMLAVGAAVDTAETYRARTTYQNAVDAAALTVAKQITKTGNPELAKELGEKVFAANMDNLPNSVGTIEFQIPAGVTDSCGTQGITAVAQLKHPTFFDSLHKVYTGQGHPEEAWINVSTTVRCGTDSVEVALVLDNSGSMSSNGKIQTLRVEATNLVNTLFDSSSSSLVVDPMKFSIVPFSTFVNVGNDSRYESWMDTNGVSPIHNEELDWASDPQAQAVPTSGDHDSYESVTTGEPLTRFSVFDALQVEWAGCVEQRPYPYHTLDDEPTETQPETMIVPAFAPDVPDDLSGWQKKVQGIDFSALHCTDWKFRNNGTLKRCKWWNDGTKAKNGVPGLHKPTGTAPIFSDYDTNGNWNPQPGGGSYTWTDGGTIEENIYRNNYVVDAHNFPNYPGDHPFSDDNTGYNDQMKRQRWTWKYFAGYEYQNTPPAFQGSYTDPLVADINNGNYGLPSVGSYEGGPNNQCTVIPMTRLTPDKDVVLDGIAQMQARGYTNIQHGMSWGWKSLSNREPLSEGRPKNAEGNRKVMIVMTDGNNTYQTASGIDYRADNGKVHANDNVSFYGAHGHQSNGRIFDGFDAIANPNHDWNTHTKAMDEHMAETCVNVKADGITVYSIAFDVDNGSSVKALLETCASPNQNGEQLYYDASNAAELAEAFDKIAADIAEISISR